MVYNTTDNRTSLSITDLTSDGEYSVTVAGRDGAGRLGQDSGKLNITLKGESYNLRKTNTNKTIVLLISKGVNIILKNYTIHLDALFIEWMVSIVIPLLNMYLHTYYRY